MGGGGEDVISNLIKAIYKKSNGSVKIDKDSITNTFLNCNRSVRQGYVLSPLLFNLYINELPQLLENNSVDSFILPNGDKLSSLFFADNLIVLSQSPSGLQNGLNILSQFWVQNGD